LSSFLLTFFLYFDIGALFEYDVSMCVTKIVKGCQKMLFFYLLFIVIMGFSFSLFWIAIIDILFNILFQPLEFFVFFIAVCCRLMMIYDKKQFDDDFGI